MSSSLVPEKPLLVYPSLAATLGLEEALMLCTLADRVSHIRAQESRGFAWYQLEVDDVCTLFPFWDKRALQRVCTNLRDKGVLIVSSAAIDQSNQFRFAFNEKVQQQLSATAPIHSPPPHRANTPQLGGREDNYFLSKNTIAPNWQPDNATLEQLAQHSIPQNFALQKVPEFVTYWRERGEKHHSWGAKFIQHTLRQWRDFEAQQHRKNQESQMSSNWQPSRDALDILVLQAGIKQEFVEDAIPEFVLYWTERGESHRTWNTKFVQHVRIQWAKFTAAIEHNSEPRPIPQHWQPSEDVYDVLRLANIDLKFAHSLIPEFVLYWRDRGQLVTSWNTKYLQHVKRMWAQRHALDQTGNNSNRSIREISLEEQLTDRSWADG